MASIKERLAEDIKTAMKSGDKARLSALRMLHSSIRKKEIDERVDLQDDGVSKIIQSMVKQRQDSIEQFKAGNRQDLVEKESAELALLQAYLPKQLSQAEVVEIVERAIAEAQAKSQKDMGAVMKLVMPAIAGRADGKVVNQVVRERLPA